MKVEIPEQLKAGIPQTTWGRVLMATPVIMTVLATLLAGLASSEMTRAQYDRAFAAQLQSKAGDQWSFFQAKRLRGALQENAIDLMQMSVDVHPLNPAEIASALQSAGNSAQALLESSAAKEGFPLLQKGEMPAPPTASSLPEPIKQAMDAIEKAQPEIEISNLLFRVNDRDLAATLRAAKDRADAYDDLTRPINGFIENLERMVTARVSGSGGDQRLKGLLRDLTVARLQCAAARYETEARLNQGIASLYELQVRKSNMSAERHHARSQRFFYGMLAAQAAVITATFAMAARQRNLLWTLAAITGFLAIILGIYVYLFI